MGTDVRPHIPEALPRETWDELEKDKRSILVDVRTAAEWSFVGVPDLSSLGKTVLQVAWAQFPDMSPNPQFVREVRQRLKGEEPSKLFFICRSGARSLSAAKAVSEALTAEGLDITCINVAEGFEGDLDREGKRGRLSGWKAAGLAWRQT